MTNPQTASRYCPVKSDENNKNALSVGLAIVVLLISGCWDEGTKKPNSTVEYPVDVSPEKTATRNRTANQKESDRLTRQATRLIREGKIDAALVKLQRALMLNRDNTEAVFRVMSVLEHRGQQQIQDGQPAEGYATLRKAGVFARRFVGTETFSELPKKHQAWIANALYNEACGHCYIDQQQQGLEALTLAMSMGFDRPELLQTDPDLESLRSLPEFANLLKHAARTPNSD